MLNMWRRADRKKIIKWLLKWLKGKPVLKYLGGKVAKAYISLNMLA